MNGTESRKAQTLKKPVPGCLGRMVNLFDLSDGVARNRLLTDKPCRDDCSLSRSQSDVARILSSNRNQFDDKLEVSKEMDSKHNSPNVVAKLMGLDTLPTGQLGIATQGINSKGFSQEHGFFDRKPYSGPYHCQQQTEFKGSHEIWQQSEKTNLVRGVSPRKGVNIEFTSEEKMALIRQKFIEAKHLSADEKLRQSEEFQDALEFLSANRDLLIKFLQEPNAMFSSHLYETRSGPPPQTKHISVLRPSKIVDHDKFAASVKNTGKQVKKSNSDNTNPAQTTRIVVIKPIPWKTHNIKAMASPVSSSSRMLDGHQRDETLLSSSVLSNGYIGDESSSDKSENEFEAGNLSDPELMSPSSRHSWDQINRSDRPYSSTPFRWESFSPESSVCREAKRRLSERWAMMASNRSCQEQGHARRSSNTLGDMLSLPDVKNSLSKGQDVMESSMCLASNLNKDEGVNDSPRNLLRSKSVPGSSTVYGDRLNVEVSEADTSKTHGSKGLTKTKSGKSSFKGKASSLFFSSSKKSSKEKSYRSPSIDESHSATTKTCANENGLDESLSPHLHNSVGKTCSPNLVTTEWRQGIFSRESALHTSKPGTARSPGENREEPSPISVLLPPFEEDDSTTPESSGSRKQKRRGMQIPLHPFRPNSIENFPIVEPIRRSLSWDDCSVELATPHILEQDLDFPKSKEEERDWVLLVQTLLSASGLDNEVQSGSFTGRRHSLGSPLGPQLRGKYASLGDRRQQRSNRMLVFDCVDAAVADIIGYESSTGLRPSFLSGGRSGPPRGSSPMLVDQVWARMKEWFTRGDGMEVAGGRWVEGLRREEDVEGQAIGNKLMEELLEEVVVELIGGL